MDSLTVEMGELAAQLQAGVITAWQADKYGISRHVRRRLADEGRWHRVYRGIYTVTPSSWLQRAWVGVMIGGSRSSLGAEAALSQLGLAKEPRVITVYVGKQTSIPNLPGFSFVRSDRAGTGNPPHSTVAEAIIDVGERWEADSLVAVIGTAVTGGYVSPTKLRQELSKRSRHRQRRLVLELISQVETGTTSALEYRYRRNVEKSHRLLPPNRQDRPTGQHKVDNWYDRYRLIVELDGRAYHLGLAASMDMNRDNLHRLNDITTLRYNWTHVVRTPCQVAHQVATALTRAGWQGQITPCPHCPG
ncbi:MAG: DUF559 domain-containing protein [Propionibacteriaceae bacterium]|jgi:very-short-patch-repair endonuclease|nr:DUF559 domain-containing protein [Propionibacteriaceae bacterium]